jgi:hypothetical protein
MLACGPALRPESPASTEAEVPEPRVHAILVNGGGSPSQNFHSHRVHVDELVEVLGARGVSRERITVFASDGVEPAPDLAVRSPWSDPRHWLIAALPIEQKLRPKRYENSTYAGLALYPARKDALEEWFGGTAQELLPGDTLLVYVTDHGVRNDDDLTDNAIVLWGEELSVRELRDLLTLLPEGVGVVALMSQCFSGSFANVIYDSHGESEPDGSVCGYFSSTADRRAYGCYAENRGRHNVGHSFRFIEALRATPRLSEAHDRVLVADRTPDVPNRTSDHYLEELVRREAEKRGLAVDRVTQELLDLAWDDESRFAHEVLLLEEVRDVFGLTETVSVGTLASHRPLLAQLHSRLSTYERRWKLAFRDLKRENLESFLDRNPGWRERISDDRLGSVEEKDRERLLSELLAELGPFSEGDLVMWVRLETMREWHALVKQARYRTEVRLGTVQRLRSLLARIAGRVYLETLASDEQRLAFGRLDSCEGLALAPTEVPLPSRLAEPAPFPPLHEDARLAEDAAPGWIGISYGPAPVDRLGADGPPGAVLVRTVREGSPADRAGITVGDVVLGPPGSHFSWRHEIRDWTMLSPAGRPAELELLRDGALQTVLIRPDPYPLRLRD